MLTKDRKGRIRGVKIFNPFPHSECHKMISLQSARLTANQIEAARRVISKQVKRIGKYMVHIRTLTAVSSKPSEVRMGKGKGAIDYYIARIKAGQVLFTISGLLPELAYKVFFKASRKLPIKIKILDKTTLLPEFI